MTDYDDLRAKALAAHIPNREHNSDAHFDEQCPVCSAFRVASDPAVILALLDELAALRADAERYRRLRNRTDMSVHVAVLTTTGGYCPTGEECDAAIDRARGGSK